MLFSQFDASEHAPLVSRVTADTNHRVNEMSRISGNDYFQGHQQMFCCSKTWTDFVVKGKKVKSWNKVL